MSRSLRAWLASLALIALPAFALPHAARGQTFMGPPHLAPVALEARCVLLDGVNGPFAALTALGADPLANAILLTDTAPAETKTPPADAATAAVSTDDVAADAPRIAPVAVDARAGEGVPACYVELPVASQDAEFEQALAQLATEEPLDVVTSGAAAEASLPVGCGGLRLATDPVVKADRSDRDPSDNCDDPAQYAELVGSGVSAAWGDWTACRELAERSELAECGELYECGEWAECGELAASEVVEEIAAVESGAEVQGGEVKGSDVAENRDQTADSAEDTRFVGSSPVIMMLEEEYLPYDLHADEPLRLRLLPFSVRRSCPLENRPQVAVVEDVAIVEDVAVSEEGTARDAVVTSEEVSSEASSSVQEAVAAVVLSAPAAEPLVKFAPSRADWEALSRWVDSLQPRVPMDCWMDDLIWQLHDALDARGPIRSRLRAPELGNQLAEWSIRLEQNVIAAAQPVMPILARAIAPPQQPIAAPAALPQQVAEKVELAVAANALHSAAGGLESVAAALRSWGTSLDRVAKAAPAEAAPLRR